MAGDEFCARCRRVFPGWESDEAVRWEAIDDGGAIICPGCLSGEEQTSIDDDMEQLARDAAELRDREDA